MILLLNWIAQNNNNDDDDEHGEKVYLNGVTGYMVTIKARQSDTTYGCSHHVCDKLK